ncbi:HAD family hydrolase [Marseilla massiliensis]|jgi:phosphoglycolate phosphatase|uniref:phosphoglycolate phosphatase n=1 Tax=Marseilla massiliensis TaxID=1841864 RepID=A0A938WUE4_9BACT|nr:HAD family hydrolase [Marseilla massiliensis]MBM6673354.1 HAD family hydrolase [Marseilla massiliensis]
MKLYDTYIFDLDGTLLYTLDDLTSSTNYAMREHGFKEHTTEEVRLMVGNGIRKLIERAIPGGASNPKYEKVYSTFISHYLEHNLDTTRPYPGITELLAKLKENGKKMAIVSNKYYKATEQLCMSFFKNYIDVAIGESESIRKKPAPDTVLEAMRRLGVGKEGTVYVGDSEVDIATARNCGIPCISVLWGFRDKDFLVKNGGDVFVEKPSEIF